MRKARYDMQQVICPNASYLGSSSNLAKPGYWITWVDSGLEHIGRVLGRIAETDNDGVDCAGYLAAISLSDNAMSAGVRWVHRAHVTSCYEKPPAKLLAWLTGDEWVSSKADIARIIAMSEHGTLQEQWIENRDNPEQAYNARPEYVQQFLLR